MICCWWGKFRVDFYNVQMFTADVSGKGVRANTLRLCPHWTANLGGDEGKLDQELAAADLALEKLVDNWDCIPKVLLGWAVKK